MIINNVNQINNVANLLKSKINKDSNVVELNTKVNTTLKNFDRYEVDNNKKISHARKIQNLEKISEINNMSEKEKYSEAVKAYGKIQRNILSDINDLQNGQKRYAESLEEKAYYESLLENDCVVTEGKFHYKDMPEKHQLREEDVKNSLDMVNKLIDYANNPIDQIREDLIYRDIYSEYSTAFSAATGINLGELDADNINTRVLGNSTKETFKKETDKVIENLKKLSRDWSGIMFEYEESRNQTESKEESKSTFSILYTVFEKQKQLGVWDGFDSSLIEQLLSDKKDYQ